MKRPRRTYGGSSPCPKAPKPLKGIETFDVPSNEKIFLSWKSSWRKCVITDEAVYINTLTFNGRIPYGEIEGININYEPLLVIKHLYIIHSGRFIKIPCDLFWRNRTKLSSNVAKTIKKYCLMHRAKVISEDKDLANVEEELRKDIKDGMFTKGYTDRKKLPIVDNEILIKFEEDAEEEHYSLLKGRQSMLYYPDWIQPVFLFNDWILKPYHSYLENFSLIHRSQVIFFIISNHYKAVETGPNDRGVRGSYTKYDYSDLSIYRPPHGGKACQIRHINLSNFRKWLRR